MKKTKYIFLFLIIIIALSSGSYFWIKHRRPSRKMTMYQATVIQRGDVAQTVSANGTLNPVTLVNVGTQVSGTVQKIYADFNDRVTKNQILLELDPTLFKAAVQQSTAAVQKAQSTLELATANEARGLKLKAAGYLSKQDAEQLSQLKQAAAADLELAKATLKKDQTNLNNATIRSPVSGVVVDRSIDIGQTVAASFQTPILFKIAQDLSKMQIDSSFAEADIGTIKPGQLVRFTVDAFPNRDFEGKVKQIRLNPTTVQNVVTYDVVVTVDNPDQILLPGMTAYVNIKTTEHKNVLLVPNAALRFRPKENGKTNGNGNGNGQANKESSNTSTVYRWARKQWSPVSCRTGITDNQMTEIISGDLKEGDSIAIGDSKQGPTGSSTSFRVRMF